MRPGPGERRQQLPVRDPDPLADPPQPAHQVQRPGKHAAHARGPRHLGDRPLQQLEDAHDDRPGRRHPLRQQRQPLPRLQPPGLVRGRDHRARAERGDAAEAGHGGHHGHAADHAPEPHRRRQHLRARHGAPGLRLRPRLPGDHAEPRLLLLHGHRPHRGARGAQREARQGHLGLHALGHERRHHAGQQPLDPGVLHGPGDGPRRGHVGRRPADVRGPGLRDQGAHAGHHRREHAAQRHHHRLRVVPRDAVPRRRRHHRAARAGALPDALQATGAVHHPAGRLLPADAGRDVHLGRLLPPLPEADADPLRPAHLPQHRIRVRRLISNSISIMIVVIVVVVVVVVVVTIITTIMIIIITRRRRREPREAHAAELLGHRAHEPAQGGDNIVTNMM